MNVFIHRGDDDRWCAVRNAKPDGRITMACGEAIDYGAVLISTRVPRERACGACCRALARDRAARVGGQYGNEQLTRMSDVPGRLAQGHVVPDPVAPPIDEGDAYEAIEVASASPTVEPRYTRRAAAAIRAEAAEQLRHVHFYSSGRCEICGLVQR